MQGLWRRRKQEGAGEGLVRSISGGWCESHSVPTSQAIWEAVKDGDCRDGRALTSTARVSDEHQQSSGFDNTEAAESCNQHRQG